MTETCQDCGGQLVLIDEPELLIYEERCPQCMERTREEDEMAPVEMEKDSRGIRINANVVNGLIRDQYARSSGVRETIQFARTIVEGLSDSQIMAIATRTAKLVGVTPDIEYVETPFGED